MRLVDRLRTALGGTQIPHRLVERATGRQLGTAGSDDAAFALVERFRAQGWAWDDLDLYAPDGHQMLLRDFERTGDVMLPEGERPTYMRSLAEAKAAGGWVVLDGDWGGQVYLTAPASEVLCSETQLDELLVALDTFSWHDQGPGSRSITYRSGSVGEGVMGGMGGSILLESLWIHEELEPHASRIADVLAGRSAVPAGWPVSLLRS